MDGVGAHGTKKFRRSLWSEFSSRLKKASEMCLDWVVSEKISTAGCKPHRSG
jgi:hypothetical protein